MNAMAAGRRPAAARGDGDAADGALAHLHLDCHGIIGTDATGVEALLGYRPEELAGCHVSRVLSYLAATPPLADGRIDPRVLYLSRCGFPFEALHRDGTGVPVELYFSAPTGAGLDGFNLILRGRGDRIDDTALLRARPAGGAAVRRRPDRP